MMIRQRILVSALASCLALSGLGAAPAQAQIFGPSDEEKAHEASQDSHLADLDRQLQQVGDRIGALEDKVRSLTDSLSQATGTNEELRHQIDLQNDKISRMQKDFAYRLCTLSAQQLGADQSGDGLNCAAAGTPSAGGGAIPYSQMSSGSSGPGPGGYRPGDSLPPIGADNGGASISATPVGPSSMPAPGRGRPPGTLGTLPAGTPPPLNGSIGSGGAARSAQFDSAMNLLAKAQYSEAAAQFRAYADANPDDQDLAPQAIFWVGNISYVRQDYAPAARAFAEVIKKYPKSIRAPGAMLKLAQSFLALGQKSEGCTTLALFKSKYPGASDADLATATSLRKTACPK